MTKISVKLRSNTKPDSQVAAFADAVLDLPDGRIQLNSLCVFKPNGKPAWIAPPATKGEKKFFPHFSLGGELRKRVEAAIFAEFEKQAGSAD